MFALLLMAFFFFHQSKSEGNKDQSSWKASNGVTDECPVSIFSKRGNCNLNGFCSMSGNNAQCSCFNGYSGNSCEFNIKALSCSYMDCGFSLIQGDCFTGVDGNATCFCYGGWSGDSCSEKLVEETVDYCAGISCNNRGHCIVDLSAKTKWSCECTTGWAGAQCGLELPQCGHEFLMDIYTRLTFLSGDLSSSLECGYSKPIIFSASTPAESDPMTYAPCICASLLSKFAMADYTHMLGTCRMDMYRNIPFLDEANSYCPACNEKQDAVMEELITSKSAACWHFVYQRADMALYWRSIWKCGCVMDVGVQSTIETVVNCPFTQHMATSDYISYENCGAGKICDWESIYSYFETEYAQINLEGSKTCKDWMESWIFSVPGEQRFEAMSDTFCPCLEYLKATGTDDDSILDCIPVTFHQLTMLEIYDQICFDALIANTGCLNYVGYSTIELAVSNYTAASMCWAAVEIASGLELISDNLLTLMCDCILPVYDEDYSLDDTTGFALDCVSSKFEDFEISRCSQDNSDFLGIQKEAAVTRHLSSGNQPKVGVSSLSSSSSSTVSSWKTIVIVELPISAILASTALFLHKRKVKRNM